jgi:hypothetical protein
MRKTFMCAFLALSLAGGQVSAYSLSDSVTPSRYACVLQNYGESPEKIKTIVENIKNNGFSSKEKKADGSYDHFYYDGGVLIERFKNKAGKNATFQDVLDDKRIFRDKEKMRVAIEKSDDLCATKFFFK